MARKVTPRLSVSYEEDGSIVLLFVPDINRDTHYHITLSPEEANRLATTLNYFTHGDGAEKVYEVNVEEVM